MAIDTKTCAKLTKCRINEINVLRELRKTREDKRERGDGIKI